MNRICQKQTKTWNVEKYFYYAKKTNQGKIDSILTQHKNNLLAIELINENTNFFVHSTQSER